MAAYTSPPLTGFPTLTTHPTLSDGDTYSNGTNTWRYSASKKVWQLQANIIPISQLSGVQPSGNYAELDGPGGKVKADQLPSFVDDILEFDSQSVFPNPTDTDPSKRPQAGVIYVDKSTNKIYRWPSNPGASAYVEVSSAVGGGILSADLVVTDVDQGSYTGTGPVANRSTIPAGTSLEEVVRKMLQKEIAPTYTKPALSLSAKASSAPNAVATPTTQEIGSSITTTLISLFTKNDGGGLTDYTLTKKVGTNAETQLSTATNGTPKQPTDFEHTFTLTESTVFTASANYDAGVQKPNNMGVLQGTPIPASTAAGQSPASASVSFSPARYSFWSVDTGNSSVMSAAGPTGVSDAIRALPQKGFLQNGSTFTLNIVGGTSRITIAYPASFGDITKIAYVQASNDDQTSSFLKTTAQVEGANGHAAETYNVYTWPKEFKGITFPGSPSATSATFNVTI